MSKWLLPLVCAVLLVPLAVTDVPPLLDYPNHLARAVILASAGSDAVLSRMYSPHWAIIPDLGVDLVLPPLLQVLPVHVAGRIVVGVALLLPVLGTVAYSRASFRTPAAWPLASALVAYNATFLLGFLNFVASIGIALLFGASWIAWRDRYPTQVVAATWIGTIALFFCHLMGLLFFFVLIVGHELDQLLTNPCDGQRCPSPQPPPARGGGVGFAVRSRFRSASGRRYVLGKRIGAVVLIAAAPLTLYFLSPLEPLSDAVEWTSAIDKTRQLVLPFANYILPLDILTACLVAAFLLGCVATGRCRIARANGFVLVFAMIGFLAAPWAIKGTYFVDTRFVILLGFLLFAAVLPVGLTRPAAISAVCVFTGLFAIRMIVVGYAWHEHERDLNELRVVIASVQPGERVMTVEVSPKAAPDYWRHVPLSRVLSLGLRLDSHLPALLLIEHHAYWPFLFDNPSQQPVRTLPPYNVLAEHADTVTSHRAITVPGQVDLCGYDHLLLLDAGGQPDLAHFAADRLALVAQRDIAALFRVRPGACLQ